MNHQKAPHARTTGDRADQPSTATDCRSRDELATAVRAGAQPQWLLFWGHRPPKTATITASCLSQWWPAPFTIGRTLYRSAEHWMMAGKAQLFGDEETRQQILDAPSPAEAKDLGRKVRGFDENTWAAARFELIVQGNIAKFGQHSALRDFLLATGNQVLVEASPYDRIWGIGLSAADARATDPNQWRGLNLLGFALMETRARLNPGHTTASDNR